MRKRVTVITIILILLLFGLPLGTTSAREDGGGALYFCPITHIYTVKTYEKRDIEGELMSHSDPDYKPPTVHTAKGYEIYIFGQLICHNEHEV